MKRIGLLIHQCLGTLVLKISLKILDPKTTNIEIGSTLTYNRLKVFLKRFITVAKDYPVSFHVMETNEAFCLDISSLSDIFDILNKSQSIKITGPDLIIEVYPEEGPSYEPKRIFMLIRLDKFDL